MNKKDGYTLIHEHITIDLSGVKKDPDTRLDCMEDTIEEFKQLYQYGVRRILDVTNMGMGRDLGYIKQVEEATGIEILVSTGFYKEPFLPELVYSSGVEELAELLVKECTEGIEETGMKACCIGEIGTSKDEMTEMEQKVFDASILAAKRCDAVISTHTTLGTYALEQTDYLISRGIDPKRIIIGHIDLSQNLDYIKQVLATGVNVAFDTVGKNNYFPDEKRVEFLLELERENLLDQVVLSLDITRKSHFKKNGGIGYTHLFEVFLPMLREKGIKEESIDKMLVENPKRILQY